MNELDFMTPISVRNYHKTIIFVGLFEGKKAVKDLNLCFPAHLAVQFLKEDPIN